MQGTVEQLGRDAKVLFVSEDGVKFRLFVDGHEIKLTRGITIRAGSSRGDDDEVEVTATMVAVDGLETITVAEGNKQTQVGAGQAVRS